MYVRMQFSCTATFCRYAHENCNEMYGANLRQTSKNAKTLESGIYFWAVLKRWMAKTFEKITKKN